jgi:hypothetical protein
MKSYMKSNIYISKKNLPKLGKVLHMFNIYIIKCTFFLFLSHKNLLMNLFVKKIVLMKEENIFELGTTSYFHFFFLLLNIFKPQT